MLKISKLLMVILLSYSSAVFANDMRVDNSSILTLVDKIKNAKTDERRALVNELKIKLRSQNKQTRQKAMMDLRRSFNGKNSTRKNFMHENRKNKNCQNKNEHFRNSSKKLEYRKKRQQEHNIQNPQHEHLQNGSGEGRGINRKGK